MKKLNPNKHGEVTAASFKRMAMQCRQVAKTLPAQSQPARDWRSWAKILDAEAKLVRAKP